MTTTMRPRTEVEGPTATRGRIPGDPGFWVLLIGELGVFSMFFGVIAYSHESDGDTFAAAQGHLNQDIGLANTVVLLGGSVLVAMAMNAVRQRDLANARRWLSGAAVSGLIFVSLKVFEYSHLIRDDFWIDSNRFWMLFFVITGAHLVHVIVGIGALLFMRRKLARSPERIHSLEHRLIESAGCYWHMVDLLWLVLFPLFYLVN